MFHRQIDRVLCLLCLAALGLAGLTARSSVTPVKPVDYNRDIRPILSEHCYACHGPDEKKRKAGLRLDNAADALKELKSGDHAIVPGNVSKSTLVSRILATDPDDKMPPEESGKPLSPQQIELLKRWVAEGAVWKNHWSLISPTRPALPKVADKKWTRNAIDHFILARLEKEGLKPNPEADRPTLLRRLSFDLTGLPPTIAEMDAFLADRSADAYEKVVDRLLASPHYGERMAQHWLDLARYADTSGYHFDGVRFMWLWRDWVIKAFNDNMGFDEFTVEQIAGDLFPNATTSQRVATGFVRNNMTNDEGGADPDEYLNKYVVDRVDTLGTVWLGMTIACSECHDHKYDPVKTKEFYQLYAFFHNVPEKGLDRIRTDNPPPRLPVPTPEQAMKFVEADFTLKDAEKTFQDRTTELGETQEKWERETTDSPPAKPADSGLVGRLRLNDSLELVHGSLSQTGRFVHAKAATNAVVSTNAPAAGATTNEDASPRFVEGRSGKALKLEGQDHLEFDFSPRFDRTDSFSYGAWVNLRTNAGCVLSKMEKDPGYRGFDLLFNESKFEVHLVSQWPENAIKVRSKETFPQKQWLHVLATYDGSGKASGVKLYVDGKPRDVDVQKDALTGSITNAEPLRIGARNGQYPLNGLVDEVRLYREQVSQEEVRLIIFQDYLTVLAKSRGNRSKEERDDLARFYKENYAVDYLRAEAGLARAKKEKDGFYKQIPSSLVMEEMQPPRDTFVLIRGDYRNRGEKVSPGTPAFLPPLPAGPTNRLALARWLVSKEQPLTPRVVVNRYWAMFFGNGLVKTANDFGAQGEWPSHPDLLDYLAVQFREGGPVELRAGTRMRPTQSPARPWDVKAMIRLIVTSATYRQSAVISPQKLERDPYNRLLTRGPRLRLDAEFIRDNALAVSGLLNAKIGGPSVKPYQPAGIWDGVDAVYQQDHGDLLYRRGMYVFWRRSAHYPSFATFDAPNREVCTYLRQRTQTPLQSLVLLNDPVYVEAARGLAQRVLEEEPKDLHRRLLLAFRHTLGRLPRPGEIEVLEKTYETQRASFQEDPTAAESLLKVGELKKPKDADPAELGALTAVANVLLNLNETITK